MTERRGLGRGLGALIPPTETTTSTTTTSANTEVVPGLILKEIPLNQIIPNPKQPRTVFDEADLDELAFSLKEVGLLQPIVVRPNNNVYEIVAGERRWRAAQAAGFKTIAALVRETSDDVLLRDALLENLHRSQLNALEEASAYAQLLDDFGCTQEELAQRLGRSRPQVTNTLRLLRLPIAVQRRVAAGVISAGHARALLALDDPAAMERLAERIISEGISVRSTEEIISVGNADNQKPTRTKARKSLPAAAASVMERLADRLDTRVKVEGTEKRGRIVIEYATLEDLRRITDLIDRD
jgi:ParB family transcriptional regulator, chromosome partitioning protein